MLASLPFTTPDSGRQAGKSGGGGDGASVPAQKAAAEAEAVSFPSQHGGGGGGSLHTFFPPSLRACVFLSLSLPFLALLAPTACSFLYPTD